MNPKMFATELYNVWTVSKEGPKHALLIAKKQMEASNPKNWSDLPTGNVFMNKGFGSDKWDLNLRQLKKTHAFWTHVYYILKKKFHK